MNDHGWMTVAEIAAALRLSKMSVYRLIRSGAIEGARFGKALRVPTANFHDYCRKRLAEGAADHPEPPAAA